MNTIVVDGELNALAESVEYVMQCVGNGLFGSLCSECDMSLQTWLFWFHGVSVCW